MFHFPLSLLSFWPAVTILFTSTSRCSPALLTDTAWPGAWECGNGLNTPKFANVLRSSDKVRAVMGQTHVVNGKSRWVVSNNTKNIVGKNLN